jgi:fermentation-respiration switch protein FrsA (DUF1100 family)
MAVLKIIGIIICFFIGVIILYLAVVIFSPGFSVPKQPIQKAKRPDEEVIKTPKFRKDVTFRVKETALSGWLYLPSNMSAPVACVIMGHGFGGTKDMLLESYAIRFVEAGMAVLTFDYRHFGESEGTPRQLFMISYQLEDYSAAIEYARSLKEIDPDRIALWGTSASGGYGLIIASKDKKIACVVGQCSALDTEEDAKLALKREGIRFFLRLFMHAQRDMGRSRFGLSPHEIPIVGKPGTLAMVTAPGAFEGYSKLIPPAFINEVCARGILRTHGYNPVGYAKDVQCPVLLQICEKDNLVSEESYIKTSEILGYFAEVKKYPIGHFDVYTGESFEKAVSDQIEFFKKHL